MRLTVRMKLLGTFSIILITMIVLGSISLVNMSKIRDNGKEVTNNWMWGIESISSVKIDLTTFLSLHYQSLQKTEAVDQKKIAEQTTATMQKISEDIQSYKETLANDEDKAHYDKLTTTWDRFLKNYNILTKSPQSAEAIEAGKEVTLVYADLGKFTDELIQYNNKGAIQSSADSEALFKKSASLVLFLGIALVILMSALSWLLIRNITIPLRMATRSMNQIAGGDLSIEPIEVRRKDEFGELLLALNGTVSHLRESVHQMQDSAGLVASSAEQLYASSDQNSGAAQSVADSMMQVASNSESQATSAGECDRVMEEMTGGVQRIAETTAEVAELSERAATAATEGATRIGQATVRMDNLQHVMENAGEKVRLLESQSHQIGEISELIGEIASQTHLLALNAAIEAARAGEHGAGFAVVAGEVRKLAAQTDESVRGISELIAVIRTEVGLAAEMMQSGIGEVTESAAAVSQAEKSFTMIVHSSNEVAQRVQEAAAAAEEMAASSEQVAASIASMGHMATLTASMSQQVAAATQEQLASSEEISSSSQMLSKVAEELQDMVKTFRL